MSNSLGFLNNILKKLIVFLLGRGGNRCYICDNEVPYTTSTRLGQTVDYVRKQVCIDLARTGKYLECMYSKSEGPLNVEVSIVDPECTLN